MTATLVSHASTVHALAVLPGGRICSASGDRSVRVWDERVLGVRGGAGANTCAATLQGHTGDVMVLAVLPDGRVASGGWDGTVRVWQ